MSQLNKLVKQALVVLAFLGTAISLSTAPGSRTVVVAGATGRVGKLLVDRLLKQPETSVRALVRCPDKAADLLPIGSSNLEVVTVADLTRSSAELTRACVGASAAVWCATGFADDTSFRNKLRTFVGLESYPKKSVDVAGIGCLIGALTLANKREENKNLVGSTPQVVMLSSAGVTRPSWSDDKKTKMAGAADIPIVRLNPGGILGLKCDAEQALRDSDLPYCIVRPCGLNEDWAPGRPVLSQGDVAVGRANKNDVADILAAVIDEPSANGKTFEMITLQGYSPPRNLGPVLEKLQPDTASTIMSQQDTAAYAQYALLQQLLPGEMQDPTALEMGVKYEEVDRGDVAPREAGAEPTEREKAVAAGVSGGE